MQLLLAPVALTGPLVATVFQMAPGQTSLSTLTGGTVGGASLPATEGGFFTTTAMLGPVTVFVPPELPFLHLRYQGQNALARFHMIWQEFQAPRGE